MKFIKIKTSTNHFISPQGYVFKVSNGKDVRIKPYYNESKSDLYIDVDGRKMNLLYLMMEYFNIKVGQNEKTKYTITDNLEIPLNSIIVRRVNDNISDDDYALIKAFKCDLKAQSSNSRCVQKITPIEILSVLRLSNFKCIYCLTNLTSKNWQLDHYYPISKGGANTIGNLVPSCGVCNGMKSNMTGEQFHKICTRISKNFLYKK